VSSSLHFKIKYELDSTSSGLHNFSKHKSDEVSSDLHFQIKCKPDGSHSVYKIWRWRVLLAFVILHQGYNRLLHVVWRCIPRIVAAPLAWLRPNEYWLAPMFLSSISPYFLKKKEKKNWAYVTSPTRLISFFLLHLYFYFTHLHTF